LTVTAVDSVVVDTLADVAVDTLAAVSEGSAVHHCLVLYIDFEDFHCVYMLQAYLFFLILLIISYVVRMLN
jgi:hypothetical protein